MSKHVVKKRTHAQFGGILAIVVGSYLLYDAYEGRGRKRPFGLKFLPGA